MDSLTTHKDLENIKSSIEDILNIQLEKESVDEVKKLLRERCQFYKEENARMEAGIKKLGLLKEDLCPEAQKVIEKLANHQSNKDCRSETIALSQTEKLRKHNNYITKMKMCIKIYSNLNEKLTVDIKIAKSELSKSRIKLSKTCCTSKDELKSLETKLKRYENELLKFEKRYPWLSNSEFNLPNISKEMETLMHLKRVKSQLLQELDKYQGLKPDVAEANQELKKIIQQHEQFLKDTTGAK